MKKIINDDNAVSISIGFILTFSITVLILVTILTSFYTLMNQAEQTVMRDEFEIHGSDIAVRITTIDSMVGAATDSGSDIGYIRYELPLPDKIAGERYSVQFQNQTQEIIFNSDDREETTVKIPYLTEDCSITATTIYSSAGEHHMIYNPTTNNIDIS